jgi:hypothetical protein
MTMSDKIRISLDDVNSLEVDQKLQQQSAVARTTEHYRQQVAPSLPSMAGHRRSTSIWYNTLFYMTIFGVLGGLLAWPACEIVWQSMNGQQESLLRFLGEANEIIIDTNIGEISEAEAESRFERLRLKYEDNEMVALLTDESLSDSDRESRLETLTDKSQSVSFISTLIFCAVGGMCIAVFLSVAEAVIGRNIREAVINGSVGLCLGMVGGIIVGLFLDKLYRAMGGGTGEGGVAAQVVARALGWAVLGLFLSVAPGIVMRSPKKLMIGLAGGFLGGLLGGGLFDLVGAATGTEWMSRLVGLVAIGAITGLGTGLIEHAAKTGWMKVVGGLISGKQFILYKNPTIVGSSPQCEIYLFKDVQVAPQHAAIRQVPQGYEIQNLGTTTSTFVNGSAISRVRLSNNDQIQIGGTTFSFQEKTKTHA